MKISSNYAIIVASTVIVVLMAIPVFTSNPFVDTITSTVLAQSQSETQQQQSQPPEKQPQQLGTQHIFNNKSKPAMPQSFARP